MNLSKASPRSDLISLLCSIAVAAIGTIALAGWISGYRPFTAVIPGAAPMKINTAIALLAAAFALARFGRGSSWTRPLGLLVCLIGTLTVVQYASGIDLGIDELLAADPSSREHPGRMGLNTAVCLMVSGFALMLGTPATARGRSVMLIAGVTLLSVASSSLLGYALGVEHIYRWGDTTRMAAPTAAAVTLLGLGLLTAVWRPNSRERRWYVGVPVGGAVAGIAVLAWVGLIRADRQHLHTDATRQASTVIQQVRQELDTLRRALGRLDERRETACDLPCERDVNAYLRDIPYIQVLGWVESTGAAVDLFVRSQSTGPHRLSASEADAIALAVRATGPVFTSRMHAWVNGRALFVAPGVNRASAVIAVLSLPRMLNSGGLGLQAARLRVRVDGEDVLSQLAIGSAFERDAAATLYGSAWQVTAIPSTPTTSRVAHVLLIAGLLVSAFVTVSAALWQASREVRLRKQGIQIEQMFDVGRVGSWDVDLKSGVFNLGSLAELYGLPPDQDPRDVEAFRRAIHPEDRDRIRRLNDALRTGAERQWRDEFRIVWPDGTIRWMLGFAELVTDQHDMPAHVAGINVDITALKNAQAAVEEANRELEQRVATRTRELARANNAKSEFLAAMSHEIRTPMNAILGMADLLWESKLDVEQRQYVDVFRRAGNNLLLLINDILDLSKIESGKFELETVPFVLDEVVDQTIDLIGPRARAKGLTLSVRRAPVLPVALAGDPHRLRQVLVNLLGNAVKFTERGEITLSIRSDGPPHEGRLIFDVADTGIGIPDVHLSRIFEDFTQADASVTRHFGGTGLGLGISRRLVGLMRGDLTVTSRVGVGSTFTFTAMFPVVPEQAAVRELADLHGRRVLVVDDDATNRLVLRETLSAWGLEVREFASPAEALREFGRGTTLSESYALVLVDNQMPGMDGFELARRMTATTANVPIVMLASDSERGDESRRLEAGIVGFAMKPINRSQLLRVIGDGLRAPLAHQHASSASSAAAGVKPLSILIAEDFADNRILIQAYLKGARHRLVFAEDGQRAIDLFKDDQFDLILMDIQMPNTDGHDATRAIRRIESETGRTRTPIVALSANARSSDIETSREAGCDAHLTKPIAKHALLSAIHDLLAQPALPAPAPSGPSGASAPIDVDIPDELKPFAMEYIEARRREIGELERLAHEGDYEGLRIAAHNVAGSGASYGFVRLSEIGKALENAARDGQADGVSRELEMLRDYVTRATLERAEC